MKSALEMPQLTRLADACLNGACNVSGIAISFGEAISEAGFEKSSHPAVKVIVGQLSYLLGESLGPREETIREFQEWRQAK